MKFSKICLFLIVVCGLLPPLARADLYVSTTGSDAAPGTKDQPLATLERARDLAREAHKAAGAPQRVILRGGSYFLKQPLVLAPEDSGLTVTALPGETPVLRSRTSPGRRESGRPKSANAALKRRCRGRDCRSLFNQLYLFVCRRK